MKPANDIKNELEQAAPFLGRLDKVELYEVRPGYFESFTERIMQEVHICDGPELEMAALLKEVGKKEIYPAPSPLYFASFKEELLKTIHAEEVAAEMEYALPVLNRLGKKEIYAAPQGYFRDFPAKMLKLVAQKKVEPSNLFARNLTSLQVFFDHVFGSLAKPAYAFAAASCLGLVVCAGLVLNHRSDSQEDQIFAQMQQLPESEIRTYISGHPDEFDERTLLHDINNLDFARSNEKPARISTGLHNSLNSAQEDDSLNDDLLD